jgi:hypothetical protein
MKEKGRRTRDDVISRSFEAIVNVRKEMPEERKITRRMEKEENQLAEERMTAMDERMTATQERLVATEERKVVMKKTLRLMEQDRNIFFMDTSNLDDKQKEYFNLCHDHVLA